MAYLGNFSDWDWKVVELKSGKYGLLRKRTGQINVEYNTGFLGMGHRVTPAPDTWAHENTYIFKTRKAAQDYIDDRTVCLGKSNE